MPGSIKDVADEIEREARSAKERGDLAWAVRLLEWAVTLRAALDVPAAKRLLQSGKHFPKLSEMDAEHRAAISEGRSKGNRMLKAARKAGYATLGDLCAAVNAEGYRREKGGVQTPFLSKVGAGTKPLPEDLGKILKRLIGWEP